MSDLYKELENLRSKIDIADQEIVKLLSKRVTYAYRISKTKDQLGLPVYDGTREKKVLDMIEIGNSGIIPTKTLKRIFSLIIKETRELEEKEGNETKN